MNMRKGFDYIGVTVSFFCHDGEGNYVFHKRSKNCRDEHGRWDCGGGGMEFGLTVEENLRKEIREEYCAEVLEYEFLGFRDVHRKHQEQGTHWIALDFRVRVDPKTVKVGEPEMCDELRWIKLNEIPTDMEFHSQIPNEFLLYKEKLI